MFENRDSVADADAERSAGPALAHDDTHDRYPQPRHFEKIDGDRLGDSAFLGADAGIRPGRIDQAYNRHAELFGELHLGQGLAIPLGVGHSEAVFQPLLGVLALVVTDEHALQIGDSAETGDDRTIVLEVSIAVKLAKVPDHQT